MSKAVKSVGKAISGVVKGVVNAVVGVVKAVVNVVASVINFVAQPFMGLLGGMPDMPNAGAEAERQQGVLVQRRGSNSNIPVVYGFRKVGSVVTFAETGSTNNQYLWVAHVLSEGVIEGLYELFLDDNQLPNDVVANLNAGRTVDVTTGKYAGRVKLQFFNGTYYSTPSASTVGTTSICKDAPSWTSSMVYNGLAVVFARYEWKQIVTQADSDNNPFGGDIPTLQACILGRKIASLVISNPESYTYANAPVRYSTNPAEILLDYLRNPYYGKGLVNDDIDWTTWRRAASKCNQVVTYVNGITGNIMSCNFVLETGQSIFANVKTLLMGFRAYMPYVQGKYKLKIEDAGSDTDILSGVATIVATFNKDNIQGNVTYTGIERSNKYNQVVITYVDPDQKWSTQQVIFPESESERQTYIALDGGRENKLEATFPTLTNYAMAKDMARLLFNKSRFQESCSLTVSSQAMELEPGDNIYIQSNLLNFTTTPWRIVQTTLNDDMTYDLACVRNPDTIYPHTRYGEEDIVLPTYVPRGATIYFPSPTYNPSIGLVPPTTAPIVGSPVDPVINPPPSTPGNPVVDTSRVFTVTISNPAAFNTGFDHGFTGNGREELVLSTTGALPTGLTAGTKYYVMSAGLLPRSFRVSTTPGGTTAVGTSGTQSGTHSYVATTYSGEIVVPVVPPVTRPLPLDTVIRIDKAIYEVVGGMVNATIEWSQPTQSNYAGVDFWYKRNISTDKVYKTALNTNRPGPGSTVSHKFENLYKSSVPYELICRVRYTSGESSTFTTKLTLVVSGAVSTENPPEFFEQVTAGWAPNTTPLPNLRDTIFASKVIGNTVFESPGVPATPRQVTFRVVQDVTQKGLNTEVAGVNIYYKLSSGSTWTKVSQAFDAAYVPGQTVTFTFPGDLGLRTYPSTDNASDNFDFIFRFAYKDATESQFQLRYMGVDVERTTVVDFVDVLPAAQGQELASAYSITLADPALQTDTRLITITPTVAANALSNPSRIFISFTPPNTTNQQQFWGVRLYYRRVTVGTAPAFTVADITNVEQLSASEWRINLPIDYDVEYQYVLVPLVRYPSGTLNKVNGSSAWIGQGAIHNRQSASDYPSTGNWFSKLNFRAIESNTIPGIEATPFTQTQPYVFVKSWKLIQTNNGTSNSTANFHYYELEFDKAHIANYDRLYVYRRTADYTANITGSLSKYYGIGRFERIAVVAGTNATTLANGNILVNLRIPTQFAEFNPYYPASASPPTTTGGQTFIQGYMATNVWGANTTSFNNEFYLVVSSGATPAESAVGVRLPVIKGVPIQGEVASVETPSQFNVSDYNSTINNWQRRFSEYRNRLADANYRPNGGAYTAPTVRRGSAVT